MSNNTKCMMKFYSYAHMGIENFKIYLNKTNDLELKKVLYKIIDQLTAQEKTIAKYLNKHHVNVEHDLTCKQKMVIQMEKLKTRIIKNDFCLCMEVIKALDMSIYQAVRFIYDHLDLDREFLLICDGFVDKLKELNVEIYQFVETTYLVF